MMKTREKEPAKYPPYPERPSGERETTPEYIGRPINMNKDRL